MAQSNDPRRPEAGGRLAGPHAAELRQMQKGTDPLTALTFFDGLPPVAVAEMFGLWRGSGLPTGHPYDGVLERLGWYGKRFRDAESADPLVFEDRHGLFNVNPSYVPLPVLTTYDGLLLRSGVVATAFRFGGRALTTSRPQARLRAIEHRGVVTATMTYDALPIHDVFRRVDADTVLGVMDLRGLDRPFFFVLTRVSPAVE